MIFKIHPQPESTTCDQELEWLMADKNNTLHDYQSSNVIRLLINKINQLTDEVDFLRNRVNQQDSFL